MRISSWIVRFGGSFFLMASLYPLIGQERAPIPPAIAQEMQALQKILATDPDNPAALFNLAMDYATIHDSGKALDLLERMAEAHTGMDPKAPAGRPFKGIADNPRFLSLIAQIEKENPAIVRSTTVLLIHERDLLPEGIAYDPTGKTFYFSSISKHKIVAVRSDGFEKDFKASGQDGLCETFGLKVDAKRRILWVVSDCFAPDAPNNAERVGLFQYDLKTGTLRFKHLLPPDAKSFLNDVALNSVGEAFTTNTGTGEVFRASPNHDGLEPFLQPNSVIQANGIAVSPDDKLLFVAGWTGVARVDIATRQVRLLAKPRAISDANLDGLYFYQNSLVGIQNPDVHPGRVMRYYLSPDKNTITRAEVLEAYNPIFDVPTTGALVGDSLFFTANPQFDKRKEDGSMPPPSELQDIYVVQLKLGQSRSRDK
jgi:sugar lactone lactonase YvrE